MTTASDILAAAAKHMADRAATYDKPAGERSMARTIAAFNAITGRDLTEAEGWLLMCVLKQVRLFTNLSKPHRDSVDDLAAYAGLLGESLFSEPEPIHAGPQR